MTVQTDGQNSRPMPPGSRRPAAAVGRRPVADEFGPRIRTLSVAGRRGRDRMVVRVVLRWRSVPRVKG